MTKRVLLTLGDEWEAGEWPSYVFLTHGRYDGARYVPERTCRIEASRYDDGYQHWLFELSCGDTVQYDDTDGPKFCQECGCKVVE